MYREKKKCLERQIFQCFVTYCAFASQKTREPSLRFVFIVTHGYCNSIQVKCYYRDKSKVPHVPVMKTVTVSYKLKQQRRMEEKIGTGSVATNERVSFSP